MNENIPIMSLGVAALAVFFGPIVQLLIARRQMRLTAELTAKQIANAQIVAKRQIVSPIRQRWIDELRTLISELISKAQAHWIYKRDPEDTHCGLLLISNKIDLMLNLNEADHKELKLDLSKLIEVVILCKNEPVSGNFTEALSKSMATAQKVLKREWERVKNEE